MVGTRQTRRGSGAVTFVLLAPLALGGCALPLQLPIPEIVPQPAHQLSEAERDARHGYRAEYIGDELRPVTPDSLVYFRSIPHEDMSCFNCWEVEIASITDCTSITVKGNVLNTGDQILGNVEETVQNVAAGDRVLLSISVPLVEGANVLRWTDGSCVSN